MFQFHTKLVDGGIIEINKVISVHTNDLPGVSHEVHIKLISLDILFGFNLENCDSIVEFIEDVLSSEADEIEKLSEQEFAALLPEFLAPKVAKLIHFDVIKQTLKLTDSTLDSSESIMYNKFLNMMELMGIL